MTTLEALASIVEMRCEFAILRGEARDLRIARGSGLLFRTTKLVEQVKAECVGASLDDMSQLRAAILGLKTDWQELRTVLAAELGIDLSKEGT